MQGWKGSSKPQCLPWLTHWGRVTHICVSKLTSVGSDNGLSPCRRQTIIWTNAGILLIGPLGTNFSENLIEIHIFSFKKMHLKMSSGKCRPFCLGLNVLTGVTGRQLMYGNNILDNSGIISNISCYVAELSLTVMDVCTLYIHHSLRLSLTTLT